MLKEILRKDYLAPLLVGVMFAVSRILYSSAGLRFDSGTITRLWHFIDIALLRNDLLRSIFHLHTQPPLMNLFTGMGLQLFPSAYPGVFHVLFQLGGLILALAIYFLGNRLGFPKVLSTLLAVWYTLSPAAVVFEHYYFYTYPTAVLLALSAVFLARFLDGRRAAHGLLFSLLLAANALTWSLFHLIWLLGCLGIAALLLNKERRKTLWLVPAFMLVFAWYAKNAVLYGSFTASTWAGLNLFKTITIYIPQEVRERWVKEGAVSELALVPPYRSPDVYLRYFPETPVTGISLLDDVDMSNGYRNQHHRSYVYADKWYMKDSLRIIALAPGYYFSNLPYSFYIFMHSASDYEHTRHIRAPFDRWDTLWNRLFYGQWQKDETLLELSRPIYPDHIAWWLALGYLLVLVATPVYLWRQRSDFHSLEYGLVLFMYWNILFVSAAGILLDIGENNRTRFAIDPFLLLLAVFFLRRMLSARQPSSSY